MEEKKVKIKVYGGLYVADYIAKALEVLELGRECVGVLWDWLKEHGYAKGVMPRDYGSTLVNVGELDGKEADDLDVAEKYVILLVEDEPEWWNAVCTNIPPAILENLIDALDKVKEQLDRLEEEE